MRVSWSLVALSLGLSGCVSGYSEFYRNAAGATPEAVARIRSAPAPKAPLLNHAGGNPKEVVAGYARQGYVLIGYSSFNSGRRASDSGAVSQGTKVGADIVVVIDPHYTGSVTSSVPITTPTSSTSYTTGNATAYGSGGVATAYGNATTTTYGSQTSYIPVTVQRFDYGALYFVKRHYSFGVNFRNPTDEERRERQSNKGVYVTTVVSDTPAFRADILPGDIVVAIDGAPVYGEQGCSDLLQNKRGQTVNIEIVRGDHSLTKSVAMEP